MARRKVNIQRSLGAKGASVASDESGNAIDKLTEKMSTIDVGFKPTEQRVYEIYLERITPDLSQPRRLLPHDLRESLREGEITPSEAIRTLVLRAEEGDTVALLILGGREKGSVEEDDEQVEDTGLLALARSIQEVGLRQPLNVYRIDDPDQPDQTVYRLGEGERRYWAHHLLVQRGEENFARVKCIVETLPDDEEIIHQRQEAENAARVDLPAISRARSIQRIMERLNIELGTRVPGENTIKLPSQRELQIAVGQRVKSFTGRAISDRMVRNYLKLLKLPPEAEDLAEAGLLTEKQLRPVMRLKTDDEQIAMVRRIINDKWSGRKVLEAVTSTIEKPRTSLREISQTTIEQRFEKRVLDAAKTVYALVSMPQENYDEAIMALVSKTRDEKTKQAVQQLRDTLEEVLLKSEGLAGVELKDVALLSIIPPVFSLKDYLPGPKFDELDSSEFTGHQILDKLLSWRNDDSIVASKLEPFMRQVELEAEALRAGEPVSVPLLKEKRNDKFSDVMIYEISSGVFVYWAHELLVWRGESEFRRMRAEVAVANA
ncbi:MAG: ParB/RepB/Spo0J family partition protein [Anaerolineae bacterium]|nr:ParB/RepB/Spo0J family partition protein [Anaerolineae bacterium]